jgi:endonuclease/exonuclease/phosphatase family metal-dependent hydrolase
MNKSFRLGLIAVAFCTAIAAPLYSQSSAPGSVAAGNGKLTVLTCNVRTPQKKDSDTGDGWDDRKAFCIDLIKRQQPDIICFQECAKIQFDDIIAAFPGYHASGVNGEAPLSNDPFEIILTSPRFDVITAASYWISEKPFVPGSRSWDNSKHPRVVNWVRLHDKTTGVDFRVINTHFDHKGQMAKEQGSKMVVEDASAFPASYPQIFAGDLNSSVTNPAIQILKDGGWTDSYEKLHGPGEAGYTGHGFLGKNFPDGAKNGKIDWIFYRGDIVPLSANILRDDNNGHYPSDHYFVSAEFSFGAAH